MSKRALIEFGELSLDEISSSMIKEFLSEQIDDISQKTIGGVKSVIKQVYDFSISEREYDFNPAIYCKVPNKAERPRETKIITTESRKSILSLKHEMQPAAVIMMLAGLRRGEVLALRWSDVNFESNYIDVNKAIEIVHGVPVLKNHTKTDAGMRKVDMIPTLIEALKEHRRNNPNISDEDLILGNLREIVIPKEVEFIGEKALGYSVIGEKLTDFKIYGTKGSIAEKYANENDIEFIDINSMKDTETVPSESQTEEITQPISDKPTEPVETQSTTDEPTEPIETQPVTTEPTEPAVTEPQPTIPEPTTSVVEPTQPITDKPTEPVTTEPQPTIPEPTTPVVEPTQSNTDKPSATVKKANPIKVSVKTKTVKLKKLKKKAQTIKAITIKDAQDKVSCKITKAAKIKKFLKINAKGVITFNKWKKAKKGTYNITVQINAKGNADYKSKKLVKTIKIKVN